MTVYLTKAFARFAVKARLSEQTLQEAATAVAESRFDADLGGGVFKQRVARAGGGKSGGFRTLIVFRRGQHSFFVHGFAKSGKSNVSARELRALKGLADALLRLTALQLSAAVEGRELIEIKAHGDEAENQG